MDTYDLVILGDINGDIMLTDDDPSPIFGQHEKFLEDGFMDIGGGSAITACQTARLGLKTAFVGKVGDDLQGRLLSHSLQRHGVDTRAMIVDAKVKTGFTVHLCRTKEGDRSMLTYAGSIAHLRAEEAPLELIQQTRHLHVSDFFLQPGLQDGLAGLFATVRKFGIGISLDPAWDPTGHWNGRLRAVLPYLDVFLPNEQELYHVTKKTDLGEALDTLGSQVPTVVVKVGSRGAVAIHNGRVYSEPGFPVEVVDSTGAGDNFNAGFLYGHLRGLSMQHSLRIACVCGAMSTRALGGIQAQLSLESLREIVGNV